MARLLIGCHGSTEFHGWMVVGPPAVPGSQFPLFTFSSEEWRKRFCPGMPDVLIWRMPSVLLSRRLILRYFEFGADALNAKEHSLLFFRIFLDIKGSVFSFTNLINLAHHYNRFPSEHQHPAHRLTVPSPNRNTHIFKLNGCTNRLRFAIKNGVLIR